MFIKRFLMVTAAAALAAGAMVAQAQDNGVIKGKIGWEGKTKKGKSLMDKIPSDPYCSKLYSDDNPLRSETLVFNDNQTVKNVFVYVSKGLPEGRKWPLPTVPAVINQKGCHYEPHILGVMVGQPILIKNSDATSHNIHAVPDKAIGNKEFNKSQTQQGQEFTEKFDYPEIMVDIKCDVHPWMSAKCGVMEHPFFAVSGDDGTFTIQGLPPGTYTVKTWAEYAGLSGQEQTVTVGTGETKEIEFVGKPPQKGGE